MGRLFPRDKRCHRDTNYIQVQQLLSLLATHAMVEFMSRRRSDKLAPNCGLLKVQMRQYLFILLVSTLLALSAVTHAGPREYLFEDKRVCDANRVFCFRGSMTWLSNPRVLHLRARVQKAPGPGMLRIWLTGANELGHQRFAPFEVQVRGNNSEIINHKMIPDYPDVPGWAVERVEYVSQVEQSAAGSYSLAAY